MSEWIDVAYKMPEIDQPVTYYFEVTGECDGYYYGDNCFGGNRGFLTDDVTRWKPRDE